MVRSIPADTPVLFGPDQFLGAHVRRILGRDNISVWGGECHVHAGINGGQLTAQAEANPDADLYIHPECGCATSALYLATAGAVPAERVKILSTGEMVDAARVSKSRQVLVATEIGMIHQLRKAAPGRRLPGGQRPGVLQVHEDDHPGQAAAPRCGRCATRWSSTRTSPPGRAAPSSG